MTDKETKVLKTERSVFEQYEMRIIGGQVTSVDENFKGIRVQPMDSEYKPVGERITIRAPFEGEIPKFPIKAQESFYIRCKARYSVYNSKDDPTVWKECYTYDSSYKVGPEIDPSKKCVFATGETKLICGKVTKVDPEYKGFIIQPTDGAYNPAGDRLFISRPFEGEIPSTPHKLEEGVFAQFKARYSCYNPESDKTIWKESYKYMSGLRIWKKKDGN